MLYVIYIIYVNIIFLYIYIYAQTGTKREFWLINDVIRIIFLSFELPEREHLYYFS